MNRLVCGVLIILGLLLIRKVKKLTHAFILVILVALIVYALKYFGVI